MRIVLRGGRPGLDLIDLGRDGRREDRIASVRRATTGSGTAAALACWRPGARWLGIVHVGPVQCPRTRSAVSQRYCTACWLIGGGTSTLGDDGRAIDASFRTVCAKVQRRAVERAATVRMWTVGNQVLCVIDP